MTSLCSALLKEENFPVTQDENIINLHKQLKSGNLGISLSSFEEIYEMTPVDIPFPVGAVNFDDGKKRFLISWRENFSDLNITEVEEYSIRIRNYPVEGYPVLSLLVGIHNGKVDSETEQDLWYYKTINLDISLMLSRIKLYQLVNCDEILFSLFDGKPENLDSFGFSLNRDEMTQISTEIESALTLFQEFKGSDYIRRFSAGSVAVREAFNSNGLPKTRDALNIYLARKELMPKPAAHNWKEYLTI